MLGVAVAPGIPVTMLMLLCSGAGASMFNSASSTVYGKRYTLLRIRKTKNTPGSMGASCTALWARRSVTVHLIPFTLYRLPLRITGEARNEPGAAAVAILSSMTWAPCDGAVAISSSLEEAATICQIARAPTSY